MYTLHTTSKYFLVTSNFSVNLFVVHSISPSVTQESNRLSTYNCRKHLSILNFIGFRKESVCVSISPFFAVSIGILLYLFLPLKHIYLFSRRVEDGQLKPAVHGERHPVDQSQGRTSSYSYFGRFCILWSGTSLSVRIRIKIFNVELKNIIK